MREVGRWGGKEGMIETGLPERFKLFRPIGGVQLLVNLI